MCRYVYADQVIGSTFIELIQQNKTEISIKDLFKFEKELDLELRKRNNTIISMSIDDVYHTVTSHARIFQISDESIKLRYTTQELSDRMTELTELLDDYFRAGLPKDISETISKQISNSLSRS